MDEQTFLSRYDPAAFDRPSVAVDVIVLTAQDDVLHVLLVERGEHPHQGRLALPGGFVAIDEDLDAAATRVLTRKAGIPVAGQQASAAPPSGEGVFLEQLYTFGAPGRDPRMRVISVAYYALARVQALSKRAPGTHLVPLAFDDAPLAFDHERVIGVAIQRLRAKIEYAPLAYALLPPVFTLHELRRVHEIVLDRELNKDSFRRTVLASGQVKATGQKQREVGHRPAALYRYVGANSGSPEI